MCLCGYATDLIKGLKRQEVWALQVTAAFIPCHPGELLLNAGACQTGLRYKFPCGNLMQSCIFLLLSLPSHM